MKRLRLIAAHAAIPALLLACAPEGDDARTDRAAAGGDVANGLAEGALQRLAQKYPVLGSEPAPEPQPGDGANPGRVPERVNAAAPERVLQTASGEATFYASQFEGRRTASGIPFRQNQMVAAHRGYPFGTILRVTNVGNDRSVQVRVIDRGPHGAGVAARGTIIDLSRRAAEQLGFVSAGRAQVRLEVLEWGEGLRQAG